MTGGPERDILWNWISSVVHVRKGAILRLPRRRERQMQPLCGHEVARSLEGNGGHTKGHAQESSDGSTERMTSKPDIGFGKHLGHVVVQVDSVGVVDRLVDESILNTGLVALVAASIAVADGAPGPIDPCTAGEPDRSVSLVLDISK